jgi:hypothetical protein
MKPFYVLLILLWFKTKLTVYQSINLTGINPCQHERSELYEVNPFNPCPKTKQQRLRKGVEHLKIT